MSKFDKLKGELMSGRDALNDKDASKLAAYIGRKKYGAKKMAKMSSKGRKK